MASKTKQIAGLEMMERDVKMFVRPSKSREGWLLVAIEKDGELKKYIMKSVPKWFDEAAQIDF